MAADKPLYIVLNKADLRPEKDLLSVLDNVRTLLDERSIDYAGVCSYSSTRASVLKYRGKHLKTFLRELDEPTDGRADLMKELNAIFRKLYNAMSRSSHESARVEDVIISLDLDLYELGLYRARRTVPVGSGRGRRRARRTPSEIAQDAQEKIAHLREQFQAMEVDGAVSTAKRIAEAMRQAIKTVQG